MNSVISSTALVPDRLWGPTSYSGETTTRDDPYNFVSVTTYRPKSGSFSTTEVGFLKEIHGYKTCLIQDLGVMNKLLCSSREFTIRPSDGATIITPIPVPEPVVPTGVGLNGVEAPTTPEFDPRGGTETQ